MKAERNKQWEVGRIKQGGEGDETATSTVGVGLKTATLRVLVKKNG
ncbi:MAG: hypothetical protein U9P07_00970 [Pseudomonadota bacterium]|nr:hypothetical protein [Pseudomonadota bacterium]